MLPYLCWQASGDNLFELLFFVSLLIGALRLCTLVRYHSRDHTGEDEATTRCWDREFVLGATAMSAALGATGYFAIAETASASVHLTIVAYNVALASAYVARNAARPKFVLVQILTIMAPFCLALMGSGDRYYNYVGLSGILFIAGNGVVAWSVHRNLVALIEAKKTADRLSSQLHLQNLTLDAAINTMPHGLAMFDENLDLAVANEQHYSLFSLREPSIQKTFAATERHLVKSRLISRADALSLFHACQVSLKERRPSNIELVTYSGMNLVVSFTPALEGGVLMLTENATERRTVEAKIERLARFDILTGLPNRHEFGLRLSRAFDALAGGGPAFAVFYVDLDGFKRVNDTLGHEIGDELLVEVSKRLHRKKETEAIISRLAGDEFAAIHLVSHPDATLSIAQEITSALKEPFSLGNNTVRISASIGIAFAPLHATTPEAVLRHADIALYRAKASGRGSTVIYDESMAAELNERVSLEADLAAAAAESAFELHYQPIYDLATGKAVSYEALMRWRHPTRGYVSPSTFIPIAEQTGRIEQLGCFAIRQACADAASWRDDTSVCVNVSVLQFRNPGVLMQCVESALASTGLDPRRLTLEITESLFIDEFESTLGTIERLKALGIKFSLDDFGTGYSSLSNLSRLPLSIVKIDQSLSRDITFNTTSYAVVEAVCSLAKRIDMIVVVEGIETQAQKLAIQSLGADRGQGWLFGKPEPARHISEQQRRAA
ncbi:putative bifunctional diguanylate cyclase/phosphodiesterase [Methylocystis heyeri]|uniref:putative bifunctional diguanylate cyclase/phosphodiesterase n=1 Tax=Methylocystis heyeri TaxID=391905 RepID=UPI001389AF39|nr:EAL domain-containing protein [Methylocystis heyeri]